MFFFFSFLSSVFFVICFVCKIIVIINILDLQTISMMRFFKITFQIMMSPKCFGQIDLFVFSSFLKVFLELQEAAQQGARSTDFASSW